MKRIHSPLICALFLAACSFATAQGSNFVLFGKGEEVPPEKKTVRPLTAPYLHEDALVTTDVRGFFLYHELPELEGY